MLNTAQTINESNATILVVEDDPSLREALVDTIGLAGYEVTCVDDGSKAMGVIDSRPISLVVSDIKMQQMDGHTLLKKIKASHQQLPVLLMTAYGTIQDAVDAMQDGASDYLVKPFEADRLVAKIDQYLPQQLLQPGDMVAEDSKSRQLVALAGRVASSDATVLICGESGTGKEVLAQFIHQNSPRSDGPFVALNCAAIPENMLEAMLFGYEKGAFTGAHQAMPGKFEQAQGGTLLLDEITEMPQALQAKLLRVLQEREVERLGGRKLIELDVRVLATTNRQLKDEVAAGQFREDLYYRLNVFPVTLPPLRERRDDIVPLTESLIARHVDGCTSQPRISEQARKQLLTHPWPGNVRELDNVIQRALILRSGDEIGADALLFEPAEYQAEAQPISSQEDLGSSLRDREFEMIQGVLTETRGNRKETAERLSISPRTLRYKLARMREAGLAIPE